MIIGKMSAFGTADNRSQYRERRTDAETHEGQGDRLNILNAEKYDRHNEQNDDSQIDPTHGTSLRLDSKRTTRSTASLPSRRPTSQTEPDADPAHPRKDEIDAKEESQNVEA
jgi:hypothetical protein